MFRTIKKKIRSWMLDRFFNEEVATLRISNADLQKNVDTPASQLASVETRKDELSQFPEPNEYFKNIYFLKIEELALLKIRNDDLQAKIDTLSSELEAAKKELGQLRSENEALESRKESDKRWATDSAIDAILSALQMSDDELSAVELNYGIYPETEEETEFTFNDPDDEAEREPENRETGRWEVVTGYCQLGGCEFSTVLSDHRSALVYAAALTKLGRKPSTRGACSTCYAEYAKDLI